MIEILFHGRGGQGSVVGAKLLADAAAKAGFMVQAFASYGAERRGGQVESYVRFSEEKILVHAKMYEPDYIIIMDESFTEDSKIANSIKKGTTVLINSSKPSSVFSSLKDCNVITIDASQIASDRGLTLPSGIVVINTTMLGAIVGLIPSIKIDHLIESLREGQVPTLERNIEAARVACDKIRGASGAAVVERVTADIIASAVTQRYPVYREKVSPCEANCPAGEKIERTAYFIQNRQFEAALETIKVENPFPGVCGRVCFHPCETQCNRNQYDEGIATSALERTAFDHADATKARRPGKKTTNW